MQRVAFFVVRGKCTVAARDRCQPNSPCPMATDRRRSDRRASPSRATPPCARILRDLLRNRCQRMRPVDCRTFIVIIATAITSTLGMIHEELPLIP